MRGSHMLAWPGGANRPLAGSGRPDSPPWMPEMPRWMYAFPVVLLIMAAVVVFAFTRTGPTDNQNTHAPATGQTR